MLFSRDPISGVLECYSDDGEYQGKIYTMGDLPLKDMAEGKYEEKTPELKEDSVLDKRREKKMR